MVSGRNLTMDFESDSLLKISRLTFNNINLQQLL